MMHRFHVNRTILLPACALAALLAAAPGFAPRVYADGIKVSAGESIESPEKTTDFIYIRGGDEGKASANLKQNQDITVAKIVEVYGGDGRNGSRGNAGMFWADDITVTVRNADPNILTFTLKSGATDGSSEGGNALFRGKGLDASSITLEKNSGLLTFSVQTLDVTAGNTTLSLTNTTANTDSNGGAGVYIGTARLGDGTLTVRGGAGGESGGAYIDTLALRGSGLFDDTANPISLGRLSIDGGTLNNANWSGLIDHAYDATPGIAVETGGVTVDLGQGEDKVLNRDLTAGTTPGGGLTKTGIGTLTLSGVNTYGGATTIKAGMLKGNIANDTDLSIAAGAAYDGDGKARSLNALNGEGMISYTDGLTVQSGDFGGVINATNTGGLTKAGAGTLTLTGNNTYGGATTIKAGILKGNIANDTDLSIAAGAAYDGDDKARSLNVLNGEGMISNTDGLTVQSGTFGGVIDATNTGGLIKDGGGMLTLTGNNTYSGGTTINGGTLSIGSDGNIGTGTNTIGGNGTLLLSGDTAAYTKDWKLDSATSAIETANSNTLSGTLSGSGSLTKKGAGTLTLTGNNTYTGITFINAGTLQIGDGGTSGSVKGDIMNNAGLVFNRSDNLAYDGNISGTGNLGKQGAGTLELTGVNTYSGDTRIGEGTVKGNIADNTNLLIVSGAAYDGANVARSVNALTGEGTIRNTDGLTVQSGDFGGVIDNTNASLIKDGTGTLTLTGNNAYTGTTTIKAGTLALSGGGTLGASPLLDLRGGGLDISGVTPASLALPDLDVRGAALLKVGDKTADFSGKTLSFYVPSDMGAGGTLLSVGGTGTTDIGNSTVRVGIAGSSSALGAGDAVTLIDASGGALQGTPANASSRGEGMQGVTLRYQFDLAKLGNRLTATVAGSPQVDPRSKALSEGFLGGMALSLQGADLAAGRGMESAARASSDAAGGAGGYGFAGFGALSGGSLRYNTGSHVDMDSLSMLTGFAWGADLAPGRLTLGAFFEYGNGSYDTYNSFGNAASVHGDGDAHYLGGGVLARMDFAPAGPGHVYAEASGRAGKTHNDYGSSDLRDAAGRKADYDSASPYYGLHGGVGYVWSLNETTSLDLYGKYFWTRQEDDGVKLSTGESLRFDDVDSSRLRFGGRFAYTVNEYVAPYIGAAWEHEFDGKARATSNGFDLDAPDLRGDTGIGEIGFSLTPSADLPLTIDLGVQGYAGKREGVTGNLQVKWEF